MTSQPPNTGFSLAKEECGAFVHHAFVLFEQLQIKNKLHGIGYIQHKLALNAKIEQISIITVPSL